MVKVLCAECKHEINNSCLSKNTRVKTNKKRKCDRFEFDQEKVNRVIATMQRRNQIMIENRIDKLNNNKPLPQQVHSVPVGKVDTTNIPLQYGQPNPITGDLSRFTSSARKG